MRSKGTFENGPVKDLCSIVKLSVRSNGNARTPLPPSDLYLVKNRVDVASESVVGSPRWKRFPALSTALSMVSRPPEPRPTPTPFRPVDRLGVEVTEAARGTWVAPFVSLRHPWSWLGSWRSPLLSRESSRERERSEVHGNPPSVSRPRPRPLGWFRRRGKGAGRISRGRGRLTSVGTPRVLGPALLSRQTTEANL